MTGGDRAASTGRRVGGRTLSRAFPKAGPHPDAVPLSVPQALQRAAAWKTRSRSIRLSAAAGDRFCGKGRTPRGTGRSRAEQPSARYRFFPGGAVRRCHNRDTAAGCRLSSEPLDLPPYACFPSMLRKQTEPLSVPSRSGHESARKCRALSRRRAPSRRHRSAYPIGRGPRLQNAVPCNQAGTCIAIAGQHQYLSNEQESPPDARNLN
jgi:hypothetical protein